MAARSLATYLYLFLLAIIWGSAYPLTKYLIGYFSPALIAFFRAALGFLVLSLFARPAPLDGKTALIGVLNMGATVLLINLSLLLSKSPGLVSVLMYTQPIFALAISATMLRMRIGGGEALGMAIGVFGVVFSAVGGGLSPADLLPVLGGFLWALGTVLYRKWLVDRPVVSVTTTMNGATAAFLLPAALISHRAVLALRPLLLLIALAVLAQGLAWLLWFKSVSLVGPVRAGEFSLLVPVFSYLFSYLFLGVTPSAYQIAGSALILTGILLVYAFGARQG